MSGVIPKLLEKFKQPKAGLKADEAKGTLTVTSIKGLKGQLTCRRLRIED